MIDKDMMDIIIEKSTTTKGINTALITDIIANIEEMQFNQELLKKLGIDFELKLKTKRKKIKSSPSMGTKKPIAEDKTPKKTVKKTAKKTKVEEPKVKKPKKTVKKKYK